jgi:hypothetical protein
VLKLPAARLSFVRVFDSIVRELCLTYEPDKRLPSNIRPLAIL